MRLKRRDLLVSGGIAAAATAGTAAVAAPAAPAGWDAEADVVVIGSGASGLPAAIVAREAGASVILLEAETHIGGHAISSGGNVPLGGGTSLQKKYGIEDSPDLLFRDLTDWSVVEPNGFPDYRYNDREIIRAFADNSAPTFELLVAHGVVFVDKAPDALGGDGGRQFRAARSTTPPSWIGRWCRPASRPIRACKRRLRSGNGLMRPLEAAATRPASRYPARAQDDRAAPRNAERAAASSASPPATTAPRVNVRARKAVILATGGRAANVNFRRMFDPRLTEEYCGVAGMPWSNQDASGEIAAHGGRRIAVGALQPDRRVRLDRSPSPDRSAASTAT